MTSIFQSRHIQSFGRRKGRTLTKEKEKLLTDILPHVKIDLRNRRNINPKDFFSNQTQTIAKKKLWLEIGFGDGEHLFHNVENHSDILMIGSEVYLHGIASLLKKINSNISTKDKIRIFPDDVRLLLSKLKSDSIDKIFILFPDPWPKKRQNKRRLLNKEFFKELSRVMKKEAVLHIATDHHEYAEFILKNMFDSSCFKWTAESKEDWLTPNKYYIKTKYQLKNKAETEYPIFLNFRNNIFT